MSLLQSFQIEGMIPICCGEVFLNSVGFRMSRAVALVLSLSTFLLVYDCSTAELDPPFTLRYHLFHFTEMKLEIRETYGEDCVVWSTTKCSILARSFKRSNILTFLLWLLLFPYFHLISNVTLIFWDCSELSSKPVKFD